jgi:hypothetical protein
MGFIPGVSHGSNPPSYQTIVFPQMPQTWVGITTVLAAEAFASAPMSAFAGIVTVTQLIELPNEETTWHQVTYV